MSGLAEVLVGNPLIAEETGETPVQAAASSPARYASSVHDEQIRALVHQLFFRAEGPQVRNVGFTTADPETDTAQLCLSVARILAEEGRHDIALIDASLNSMPLHLRIGEPESGQSESWELEPRLWLVSRPEWVGCDESQPASAKTLMRLRGVTMKFDFSILCCSPMSWFAARVGRACDGLVLVLTANKTRRLVAEKMREQLRAAGVPLLGTVLAERRFPVPMKLYRKL